MGVQFTIHRVGRKGDTAPNMTRSAQNLMTKGMIEKMDRSITVHVPKTKGWRPTKENTGRQKAETGRDEG